MTNEWKSFPRPTEPDPVALATALASLLPTATGGAPNFQFDGANVSIDYGDWAGKDLQAVQNAVTACVQRTPRLDAQNVVDNSMDLILKAFALVCMDEFNDVRAAITTLGINKPQRTANQIMTSIKNKIATLI